MKLLSCHNTAVNKFKLLLQSFCSHVTLLWIVAVTQLVVWLFGINIFHVTLPRWIPVTNNNELLTTWLSVIYKYVGLLKL